MRSIACLVLTTFCTVMYSPAIYAAYHHVEEQLKYQKAYPVFDELDTTMGQLHARLETLQAVATKAPESQTGFSLDEIGTNQDIFETYLSRLEAHDRAALDYFDGQEQIAGSGSVQVKTLLAERKSRYLDDMTALQAQLEALTQANTVETFANQTQLTLALVEQLRPNRIHHSYDQDMPFGPLEANAPEPMVAEAELQQMLGEPASGTPVTTDLLDTPDIQFTALIQQKAGELGNDPVQIYNWVYNSISFVPSHGSIQGAGHTFNTGKGNAIDTASLTIALMRSAGIPSRYQYGTVWLPIDQVMNWVGGVKEPESAQILLSQGGIPDTLIKINGEFRFVELEHTWVEYWDGSQWVAVDPSFKQYEFSEGVDLADQVPFDAQAFANTLQQGATVNEAEGWVQNVDQTFIQTEMDSYRQALEDFLNNQHPDATVADILGDQQIIQRTANTPPAQLPYAQIRANQPISEIPDNLRHKFKFELQSQFGSPLLTHTAHTVELAGKQLAFSFSPATEADEQALLNYLPDNPQTPEELPDTIPVNLFNVIGEFSIGGQTVATSGSLSFGQELKTEKGLWSPQEGWSLTSNPIITGEYQAIGLDLHGIAPSQLSNLKTNLENTQTQISNDAFDNLTKHDVVGDLLQSGVIGYLAITDIQSQLSAQSSDIVYYREPSYGTFSISARINYFFGVPQSIQMEGVLLDMDRMKSSAECRVNCWNDWVDFNRNSGVFLSIYEHIIPERVFSTPSNPIEGISAIRAISIAAEQGQRIYFINQDNLNTVLGLLSIEQSIKDEITTAVQNGMEVTVSQSNINYAGWTGVGYIVIDPDTGAGAYKISGGSNGGFLFWVVFSVFVFVILGGLFAATFGGLFAAVWAFAGFLGWIASIENAKSEKEFIRNSLATLMGLSLSFAKPLFNSVGFEGFALLVAGEGFAFILSLLP